MLQIAQGLVGAVPVVGGILKTGYAAIGAFSGWMGTLLGGSCETKKCCWPRSYSRRNLIGLNPAPMGCYGSSDRLFPVPFAMHDGLVRDGAGEIGTPDMFGRLRGAGPLFHKGSTYPDVWLRKNPFYAPLGIPKGDYDRPWRSSSDDYYNRAWKVRAILMWAQNRMPCTHLICMFKILNGTLNAPEEIFPNGWWSGVQKFDDGKKEAQHNPATDMVRRKGSRWYASLYYFHRDLWDMCNALPADKVVTEARSVGLHKFADAYEKMAGGYVPDTKHQQLPGWYALREVNWSSGLILFAKVLELQPAPPMLSPAFASARMRNLLYSLRPVNTPVTFAEGPLRFARALRTTERTEAVAERNRNTAITVGLAGVAVVAVGAAAYYFLKDRED
jgi:hypothetical protein